MQCLKDVRVLLSILRAVLEGRESFAFHLTLAVEKKVGCSNQNLAIFCPILTGRGFELFTTDTSMLRVKGATSQVAGRPTILDRTVIVLDRTVTTIYGVLSFPSAWRWVRPSLVTLHYETHQRTGPLISLLSQ